MSNDDAIHNISDDEYDDLDPAAEEDSGILARVTHMPDTALVPFNLSEKLPRSPTLEVCVVSS